jgi:hypothetical protein
MAQEFNEFFSILSGHLGSNPDPETGWAGRIPDQDPAQSPDTTGSATPAGPLIFPFSQIHLNMVQLSTYYIVFEYMMILPS